MMSRLTLNLMLVSKNRRDQHTGILTSCKKNGMIYYYLWYLTAKPLHHSALRSNITSEAHNHDIRD